MNTVSWVRVGEGGAGPGKAGGAPELLAVGRFVFSPDGRLSVAQVQHTQDYMLIIQVILLIYLCIYRASHIILYYL